jgi:dephospho-CoA kinase
MTRVGLTGNYGMGKSLVLGEFRKLGAFTIDSDEVVAGLLAEGPVREKIRGLLGGSVFDAGGGLLKERVAEIIFADAEKRKALEALLHPLVFARVEEMIRAEEEKAPAGVAVVEAPLLFEGGHEGRFHKTVTVYCEEALAIERLEAAGVERAAAAARIESQMPIEEKIRRSDYIIENSGTAAEAGKRVRQIYGMLRQGPA